jgi:hypothetical protein
MARKNHKHGQEGGRVIVWGVAFSLLAAALAMLYLSLFNTCESIGRQIKRLESEQAQLRKDVVNEERNWATARSIRNMEIRMEQHGIVMSWPEEKHIIRLRAAEPDDPVQVASRAGAPPRD